MNENQIKVAKEIIKTEITYVEKLGFIYYLFYQRAKALNSKNNSLLSEKEFRKIFMNIEEIYKLNKKICDAFININLKKQLNLITCVNIVLSKFTPHMKQYTHFTNNYNRAAETMKKVRSRPNVRHFFTVGETSCGEDFLSLLILPVQRIPRYVLLLKELDRLTPDTDIRIKLEIKNNITNIEHLVSDLNKNVKLNAAKQKVLEIQQSYFRNEIVLFDPNRYVILIKIMEYSAKDKLQEKKKELLFVLCNDIILWAEVRKIGIGYKFKLLLEGVESFEV